VGVFNTASTTPFSVLYVVPDTISLAHPANDTHGNTDDSDIKPDMIAVMPPHAKVSTLLAAHPISETGLGVKATESLPVRSMRRVMTKRNIARVFSRGTPL